MSCQSAPDRKIHRDPVMTILDLKVVGHKSEPMEASRMAHVH
ncbi:unnamed protein product, partial [Staurois parvus]